MRVSGVKKTKTGASDFDTSHYESAYAVIGFMIDNYQMLFGFLTPTDGSVYRRSVAFAPAPTTVVTKRSPVLSRSSSKSTAVRSTKMDGFFN